MSTPSASKGTMRSSRQWKAAPIRDRALVRFHRLRDPDQTETQATIRNMPAGVAVPQASQLPTVSQHPRPLRSLRQPRKSGRVVREVY